MLRRLLGIFGLLFTLSCATTSYQPVTPTFENRERCNEPNIRVILDNKNFSSYRVAFFSNGSRFAIRSVEGFQQEQIKIPRVLLENHYRVTYKPVRGSSSRNLDWRFGEYPLCNHLVIQINGAGHLVFYPGGRTR